MQPSQALARGGSDEADRARHEAKRSGRDRITVAPERLGVSPGRAGAILDVT